jgi:oxygen-dependent protoporphyrinogen oxidase
LKIAIIGGGISGLATAFYLKKYSPANNITIFEAQPKLGGKLETVKKYGFSIEIGASGICGNASESRELLKDAHLEHLLVASSEKSKKRYFFDKGELYILPNSISNFLNTKALGFFAKSRALMDFIIPTKKNIYEENLQKFGARRVGKSTATLFFDLLNTTAFASTPEKLSAGAAFPWLVDMENKKGSILKNIFTKISEMEVREGFKNGSSAFIEALSASFAFNKKLNTEVVKVKKIGAKWLIEANDGICEEFDKVVLAVPSYVSARVLKEVDEELCELLKNIEYSPLAVVALGYSDFPHPLDGFGLLTTKRSNTGALGILWDSSIFPHTTSDGNKLLRVVVGGQRQPLLALKEEDELFSIATGAVSETMGVYEEPMIKHITRWHKALPNYAPGHLALVQQIFNKTANLKGMYLNSSAYNGISVNDCIKNSKQMALKIISE